MKIKLTIIWLFYGILGFGQQNTIPFYNAEIDIDGILNESVWSELTVHSNFNNYFPLDEGKTENRTDVKIFHNGTNLYVSAMYMDNDKAIISSLKRDDYVGNVLQSDCFQIVLDPFNENTSGYFFAVNTSNAQLDALVSFNGSGYNRNDSWNTIWNSEVSREGDKTIFEIEIPLKALSYNEKNKTWGINFVMRNSTPVNWTSYSEALTNNLIQYDLRGALDFKVEDIPTTTPSKFIVTPSATYNYQKNITDDSYKSKFKPSLDAQYNITSSLRLDATINPDFSQIDVDQQVTNLTRFDVFFPERRNFFIENSDLFSNLGTDEVNPFYSRKIGTGNDILFGMKLSGNVAQKTRIGVLNTQTEKSDTSSAQNYGAMVLQQQLSDIFTATGFLVNRQMTDGFKFKNDFNRVAGLNINYKSKNNKWTGLANFGNSFSNVVKDKNQFYNVGIDYSSKKLYGSFSTFKVGKNYLTDIGFVPRLNNYDAINQQSIREGYSSANGSFSLWTFPKSKRIQSIRYLRPTADVYWDEAGEISQVSTGLNQAIFFKSSASAYIAFSHDYINLKYGFAPLKNGNYIQPNKYSFGSLRLGFNSPINKRVSFKLGLQHGDFYNGKRNRAYLYTIYRLLPFAKLKADYEINHIDLKQLGNETFHLARFTGEVFFSNRLNWTTYVQYNTQYNNFNVNSRLQWEYKPLSFIYLVISDNYNTDFGHKNWGIAFKINYRLDF